MVFLKAFVAITPFSAGQSPHLNKSLAIYSISEIITKMDIVLSETIKITNGEDMLSFLKGKNMVSLQ